MIQLRTMNRVLITHRGLVHNVLQAPAVMADRICKVQGCSRAIG